MSSPSEVVFHLIDTEQTLQPTEKEILQKLVTTPLLFEDVTTIDNELIQRFVWVLFQLGLTAKARIRGFILRFLADLMQASNAAAVAFSSHPNAISGMSSIDPKRQFLEWIEKSPSGMDKMVNPSMFILATALREAEPLNDDVTQMTVSLIQYCVDQFHVSPRQLSAVEFAINACAVLSRRKELRHYLIEFGIPGEILSVLKIIRGDVEKIADGVNGAQMLYEILRGIWLLSFEARGVEALHRQQVIPQLHRILKQSRREKYRRVALLSLRNFINAQKKFQEGTSISSSAITGKGRGEWQCLGYMRNGKGPNFTMEMVSIGLPKTLERLSLGKFSDEDIPEEIAWLKGELEGNSESLTSFSEYLGDLLGGVFEWSPSRKSERFWRENATKFEEQDHLALTELFRYLTSSEDTLTLAIVCHDIGEYIRYSPGGSNFIRLKKFSGLKRRLAELIPHPNHEVSKQALATIQRVIIQRWDYPQAK